MTNLRPSFGNVLNQIKIRGTNLLKKTREEQKEIRKIIRSETYLQVKMVLLKQIPPNLKKEM